jgi:hypothetical protein
VTRLYGMDDPGIQSWKKQEIYVPSP